MSNVDRFRRLTLPEIADHHSLMEAAVFDLFADSNHAALSQYAGSSLDEVRGEALNELAHTSSLSVLACVEAELKLDYDQRVSARGRSPLSRALRAVSQEKDHVRLDEDILAAWREHSDVGKPVIFALISAFKYRHWLAHGRSWTPKFGRKYDYETVYSIADAFLSAMVEGE